MLLTVNVIKTKSERVSPDSHTLLIPCCSKDRTKFLLLWTHLPPLPFPLLFPSFSLLIHKMDMGIVLSF